LIVELKENSARFARQFPAKDRPGFGLQGNGLAAGDLNLQNLNPAEALNRYRQKQYGR
jgi:hypothetical protein